MTFRVLTVFSCLLALIWLQDGLAETTDFAEVGLSITPPSDFTQATNFYGFQQDSSGASLVLASLPGPYPEVAKGFTKEGLASQGMTLISKEPLTIHDLDGALLALTQEAHGVVYKKWLVAFGDSKLTYLVTANFPEAMAESLGDPLKQSVLSVRPIPLVAGESELDFTLSPGTGLSATEVPGALGKLMFFSQTGRFPFESQDEPIFIAAPSMGKPPVSDKLSYAEGRLSQTAGVTNVTIKSKEAMELDGLSGVKIVAEGDNDKTGTPTLVYQLMLFYEEGGYLLMTGMAPQTLSDTYLQAFEATANSFKDLRDQ